MSDLHIAVILTSLIVLAGMFSIEFAISAAIIEIFFGIIAGNLLHIQAPNWLDFLASCGGILLIFLAGTEVDGKFLREKLKESLHIGGLSFLLPFALAFVYAYFLAQWNWDAAKIVGIVLSTTSLAVVYTVLVESGLNTTQLGKLIMVAMFITNFGTALSLSLLFLHFNYLTLLFLAFSFLLLVFGPKLIRYVFTRYANKVIEPEIKLLFLIFFITMLLGELGASHAILPVFVLGFILSDYFRSNPALIKKMRTVGFAMIIPFFFINGGLKVDFHGIVAYWPLVGALLAVKIGAKFLGIYPVARLMLKNRAQFPKGSRVFATLLLSTGLTFDIITCMFGLKAGFINQTQFSVLLITVILSAIVPTIIAQRYFMPLPEQLKDEVLAEGEEG